MDPQLRKLLEVSYEAWKDSGIDHVALRGSNQVCSKTPAALAGHSAHPRMPATGLQLPPSLKTMLRASSTPWLLALCVIQLEDYNAVWLAVLQCRCYCHACFKFFE